MALILTFILGVGNFACHRAVVASGHPMLAQMAQGNVRLLRWVSLVVEFVLLVAALYAAKDGTLAWVWAYAGYTLLNASAAWALLRQ
jgi:hypothetical protein